MLNRILKVRALELRNRTQVVSLYLTWVSLHLLSVFRTPAESWGSGRGFSTDVLLLLVSISFSVISLCFFLSAIGFLKKALFRTTSGYSRMQLGSSLLAVTGLLVLYLVIGAISDKFYAASNTFLTPAQLSAGISHLGSVATHTSVADMYFLSLSLAAALGVAAVLVSIAPADIDLARSVRIIAAAFAVAVSALYLPGYAWSQGRMRLYYAYNRYSLGPHVSMLWAPLLLDASVFPPEEIRIPLVQRSNMVAHSGTPGRLEVPDRKNILLILVEALRYIELDTIQKNPGEFPTFNRLLREGMLYERAYSASTESVYSKVSIVTGGHALRHPLRETFSEIRYPVTRIYDLLAKEDFDIFYVNSSADDWQNAEAILKSENLDDVFEAEHLAFDELQSLMPAGVTVPRQSLMAKTAYFDIAMTAKLREKILGSEKRSSPFFAIAYYSNSHFPFSQEALADQPFQPADISYEELVSCGFLSCPDALVSKMHNRYLNTLTGIDDHLSSILNTLREAGQLENSIIILSGDHGSSFGYKGYQNHAGPLIEPVIHVPLIFWNAGEFDFSVSAATPVSHVDIAPTILSLAGLPQNPDFQGRTLGSWDGSLESGEEIVPVFANSQSMMHQDAIIAEGWKFIADHRRQKEELYNIVEDSSEEENLIQAEIQIVDCFRTELQAFISTQLAYYDSAEISKTYYPPKYRLSRSCSSIFKKRAPDADPMLGSQERLPR